MFAFKISVPMCLVLTVCIFFSFGASEGFAQTEKPNIILIMADDLGYGDLGCYGSKLNTTPNIDKLAAQGIRFTDFHGAAWCAPSRIALMTGCHPNRPGLLGRNANKLAKRITLAEMLKGSGYATALIGKWHLGMGKGTHPLDQGFDYWYGTRGSNDWDGPRPNYGFFKNAPEKAWKTPIYRNRKTLGICPQSQFTQRYTKETIGLINKHKDGPFFIYLAHNMPHVPIFASKDFKGKSKNGVYGDVLMELDWSVGEIVKTLREVGISQRTLIIFTSDNGPWTMFREFGGVAIPLRGEKSTAWEGGSRVPGIFFWPGIIQPATKPDFIVNLDVYATVASLTGTKIPKGHAIDSHDMSKVLLSGAKGSRTKHLFYIGQPHSYRNGNFKIHLLTRERTRNPKTGKREPSIRCDPPLLFNLKKDIGESKNIAAKHLAIVERLTAEFRQAQQAIRAWKKYD
ncbi:MAG: sulfatase [Gemmataceae bacterium]